MYMAPIDKATAVPLSFHPAQRRAVIGASPPNEDFPRLVRFTGATVAATLLAAVLYLVGALALGLPPQIANGAAGALAATAVLAACPQAVVRWQGLIGVAAVGLALNGGWVWLAVTACGEAAWTPVPPMLLGTPLATFAAGRLWVFR